jgi:hypothetical protein
VAFALELFDRRIRSLDDLAGVPVLGILRRPAPSSRLPPPPFHERAHAANTGPALLGMGGARP